MGVYAEQVLPRFQDKGVPKPFGYEFEGRAHKG